LNATILFVPGLPAYVADHWQTLLAEQTPGSHTVPPLTETSSAAPRVEALDQAVRAIEGRSCWSRTARLPGCSPLGGARSPPEISALLATPAGYRAPLAGRLSDSGQDSRPNSWLPAARPTALSEHPGRQQQRPALRVRAVELATPGTCLFIDIGAVSHLNPAAGFRPPGPRRRDLLQALDREAVA
jgi:hypothetical protein